MRKRMVILAGYVAVCLGCHNAQHEQKVETYKEQLQNEYNRIHAMYVHDCSEQIDSKDLATSKSKTTPSSTAGHPDSDHKTCDEMAAREKEVLTELDAAEE